MIAMEDKRREQVEKEIAQMELEERKHIDNLRKLQDEQKVEPVFTQLMAAHSRRMDDLGLAA